MEWGDKKYGGIHIMGRRRKVHGVEAQSVVDQSVKYLIWMHDWAQWVYRFNGISFTLTSCAMVFSLRIAMWIGWDKNNFTIFIIWFTLEMKWESMEAISWEWDKKSLSLTSNIYPMYDQMQT